MRPLQDRLIAKVNKTETCWIWTGATNGKGYGKIQLGKRGTAPKLVHRISFEIFKTQIPCGMVVLHICDNPLCVNPDHLKLGTPKDNSVDMSQKKRANGQVNQPHHQWWISSKAKVAKNA